MESQGVSNTVNNVSNFVTLNFISILYVVFAFVVIGFVFYVIVRARNKVYRGVVLIDEPVDVRDNPKICRGQIKSPESNEYTFSFWFYVNNWNPTHLKHLNIRNLFGEKLIFVSTIEGNNLAVSIGSHSPNLIIRNIPSDIEMNSELSDYTYKLENIRLQSWNHVTISIWNGTMDLYIDGKLARTFVLKQYADSSSQRNRMNVGGAHSYDGYLSKLIYYPRVITPYEVYSLYKQGPTRRNSLFRRDFAKVNMSFNNVSDRIVNRSRDVESTIRNISYDGIEDGVGRLF